jgi:phosphate acetyltransferase
MSMFIEQIHEKAKKSPKKVVLQEGEDVRVIEAAATATKLGLAEVTLLGDPSKIKATAASAALSLDKVNIVDMTHAPNLADYAQTYYELRKAKGMTPAEAEKTMKDPLFYGAMMVRKGVVDSFVGGATYTTADVCRASIQIVGMQPGLKTLSSFFAMILPDKSFGKDGVLFYGDGGVVIDPNVDQLADIAIATADSYASLVGEAPRVAMLSCSTKGSAKHPRVDKVIAAMEQAQKRRPDLVIDGEMQGDAALVPAIGERKAKGSPVAGKANVLIFPDLDSGNISYKLTERLAKAEALGPVLQGMAKPSSDLSRGCKANDIVNVIAINVVRLQFAQK